MRQLRKEESGLSPFIVTEASSADASPAQSCFDPLTPSELEAALREPASVRYQAQLPRHAEYDVILATILLALIVRGPRTGMRTEKGSQARSQMSVLLSGGLSVFPRYAGEVETGSEDDR